MSDLAEFLAARLDEDEAAAKAWLPFGNPDAAAREHIARHDPGRVLRDVEAKRKILAQWQASPPDSPVLTFALHALASVYSDHPDYRQEWA